ncbi:DUF935 domain-containing protein [Aquincola tertiaricarbonis]|uniref:DUF935 domain-containing protein n=1 Tax=Aquincola tertiaricarbonis TaxID=391953 RepID=A0ABY4SIQ4_AQUTE|nr:DUF935 family protein [Aquincola tertiaricarbonis]URI11054.1 DUF935 domain-containing protein [Aquincola tertiaricarbonis]
MIATRGLINTVKGWLSRPIATPETDPRNWLSSMLALPNPDPILRRMGDAERVYLSIMADAHVLGDIRSVRGNFRAYDWRINAGNEDDPQSMQARQLCEDWMRETAPGGVNDDGLQLDWQEVMWQMTSAVLTGYHVHEVVWELVNGDVVPGQVLDRPGRRFKFDAHGRPLLISVGNMIGAPVENPSQFVISRHMPSAINPYGVAVLSSCFWPWTFKTGGWRYFVKYCERHGLPWPFATYPQGTLPEDIDKLEQAIAGMLESGYVIGPDGSALQLLTPTGGNSTSLPQADLIDLCNREMSKAVTGQAMVAELQGVGARAAGEIAAERQKSINDSDRDIAVASMNQLFKWITRYNFGDGVAPPELEFFQPLNAGKDRAETYKIAADMGAKPSRSAMLEELGIPQAETDEDALLPKVSAPATPPAPAAPPAAAPAAATAAIDFSGLAGYEFARAAGMTEAEAAQLAAEAADRAIEDNMIAPVVAMLERYETEGKTLAEFHADLQQVVGVMDDAALREVLDRALSYSILRGAATQAA